MWKIGQTSSFCLSEQVLILNVTGTQSKWFQQSCNMNFDANKGKSLSLDTPRWIRMKHDLMADLLIVTVVHISLVGLVCRDKVSRAVCSV